MYFNTGTVHLTCTSCPCKNASRAEFPKIGTSTFYPTDASVKIFVSFSGFIYILISSRISMQHRVISLEI